MLKKSFRLVALSCGLLAFASCAKHVESFEDSFPQFNSQSECPAGYNPIALENPAAAVVDLAATEKSGSLSYLGAEFYYEISEGGAVKTQVHANEVAGGRLEWNCSNHQSGAYAPGTDLIVSLELPIAASNGVIEMEAFQIEATDSYLAMTSGSRGARVTSMAEALKATPYKFYHLGGDAYELRVATTETLNGKFEVKKTAIVRYNWAAK